jgi:hypothetical protein
MSTIAETAANLHSGTVDGPQAALHAVVIQCERELLTLPHDGQYAAEARESLVSYAEAARQCLAEIHSALVPLYEKWYASESEEFSRIGSALLDGDFSALSI